MYSVVLADDEPMILDELSYIVPWQELGFEIKAKVYESNEFIVAIQTNLPDVLITDIQMLTRTGLEYLSMIKEISPDTIILVLSRYAKFEYAKKVMNYGVEGFLLKPINRDELLEYLIKFKEKLNSRERNNIKRKVFNDILVDFLDGNSSLKRFDDIWWFFRTGSPPKKIILILFKINKFEKDKLFYSLLENIFDKTDVGIFIRYSPSLYISIIYNPNYLDVDVKLIDALIDGIKTTALNSLNLFLSVIRSHTITPERMARTFNELKLVIFTKERKENRANILKDYYIQIIELLKIRDFSSIDELIVGLLPMFSRISLADAGLECCSIIFMIRHEFEIFYDLSLFTSSSFYLFLNWWQSLSSVDEMIFWLRNIFTTVASKIAESKSENSTIETAVNDICHYIDCNYMTLSRSSVAEHFKINPSYLSQIFKRVKGISFIDYVTEIRVKNAKRLLKLTNVKIQVVAEEVGYSSPQHFSKIFEKAVGLSPTEYRKKAQANKNIPSS